MNINTNISKKLMETVINPDGTYSDYDDKAPKDWDVGNFVGFVSDQMNSANEIIRKHPLLKEIFKERITMDMLNKGSGLNSDKEFNKFKNWKASLYDIWIVITKAELQVNLHYSEKNISACGMIAGRVKVIIANNFPALLKKVRSLNIRLENLTLTFQPED